MTSETVEYLLVGGYAVSYHGYPRTTGDIDLWVARNPENAAKLVTVFQQFGFDLPLLSPQLFLARDQIVRLGVPPLRIEILTSISGVTFESCARRRVVDRIDGVEVPIIGLHDLKANKRASGRLKDLADLDHLP